jgi:hypothetical protein
MKRFPLTPGLDVNSWDRVARDPVNVGAFLLTGSTAAAATATGLAYLGYAAVGYLATTALTSLALSALAPDLTSGQRSSSGLQANIREPNAAQEYVYGQVRKGGVISHLKTSGSNNKDFYMIIVLAGHPVEEIGDIYINDEIVTLDGSGFVSGDPWNNKVRIEKNKGNEPIGPIATEAFAPNPPPVGADLAYITVKLEYDQSTFSNGIPNFSAVVKGKKVYDPRNPAHDADDSSTWEYSANSALCIADYIRADYGLADSSYGRIDDTMLQVAANISDELVPLAVGGTESRYECHGVLSASRTPASNLQNMLLSCAGTLFWGGGKWKIKVGAYSSPVKSFTLDDLRSDISVKTRSSSRDNFNMIQGTFNDASQDWITVDYPAVKSTGTFLFEDNGVENALDLQMPFTTSASAAQRLAKMMLFRNREQIVVNADFGMSAFEIQVGDVVRLTIDRYGWSEKEFEVSSWSMNPDPQGGDMRVSLTLNEISEAAFAWDAEETELLSNNSTLPKYNDPINFGFTPRLEVNSFGEKLQRDLAVQLTSSNIDRVSRFEVQIKPTPGDVTALLNREAIVAGLGDPSSIFSTQTIDGRKLGDFDNDGNVDSDDIDDYVDYYFGALSDATKLERIDQLHSYVLEKSLDIDVADLYSPYVLYNSEPQTDYQTVWNGAPSLARIPNIGFGRWDIRVRVFSSFGFVSGWVESPRFEVPYSDKLIASPTGGNAIVSDIQSTTLMWEPDRSQTLSHYDVRYSNIVDGEEVTTGSFITGHHYRITNVGDTDFTEIGASANEVGVEFWCHNDATAYDWDAVGGGTTGRAVNVVYIDKTVNWVDRVARPANHITSGTKKGTYIVRSISKAGTPAANYLRIPVRASEFNNPFTSSTTSNDWATPQSVGSDALASVTVTTSTAFFPSGDYAVPFADYDNITTQEFTSYSTIDVGSVSRARVTVDIDFIRANTDVKGTANMDSVFGMWDNIGMSTDDVTNQYQADMKFTSFVRMSDDNVTYSDWQRVTANIVSGRYFQFKVVWVSPSYKIVPWFRGTPSISTTAGITRLITDGIKAKVEY